MKPGHSGTSPISIEGQTIFETSKCYAVFDPKFRFIMHTSTLRMHTVFNPEVKEEVP